VDDYIPRLSSASGDIADRFGTRVSTDCCKIWLWSLPASFISSPTKLLLLSSDNSDLQQRDS
jgi:hypothetical protein